MNCFEDPEMQMYDLKQSRLDYWESELESCASLTKTAAADETATTKKAACIKSTCKSSD